MWSRRNPSQRQKKLWKRRLQNGDHWYKSAGENKKIEVRTEICWVLCYIKVSLSKSFLLCMYFYKGFLKKTQITGSIEKILSMGKMRQTRYLRLITQMSLKKRSQIVDKDPPLCFRKMMKKSNLKIHKNKGIRLIVGFTFFSQKWKFVTSERIPKRKHVSNSSCQS